MTDKPVPPPPPPAKPPGPPPHANRDQDPKHPANITPAYDPKAPPPPPLVAGDFMTEQEKDGMGPAAEPVESPGPVETIAQQGIGPKDPYPEGDPPAPSETVTIGQGIKGVTDKPVDAPKPGKK